MRKRVRESEKDRVCVPLCNVRKRVHNTGVRVKRSKIDEQRRIVGRDGTDAAKQKIGNGT